MKKMKKMKKMDRALLIICTVFVLIIGSLIFILPKNEFSESENRYLATMPNFSIESLINGEYTKEISSFYKDQFPMRKIATSVYAISESAMGKKSIRGVIKYNNMLIPIEVNKTVTEEISIPAVCIESKYSLFKSQSNELLNYYNTDHHRSTYGAYLVYLEACQKLKIQPYPESYFTKERVCDDFYGTSFFKSALPKFAVIPDFIELWRYENDEDVILTIHDSGKMSKGFYDFSKLGTADKYAIFLGGNYAHATVASSVDKPTVLLFKDSFANAVVPFLALHFNIEIIDPRYATKTQISAAYNSADYDYVLFIGCLDSFN